ncbi:DUF3768 domain-containing protein [Novosphingobium sp. RD2P27]|uniref:DUF3768 domain-containing protein n=1 Tax=Novosphingobium kalidii TaxID=3230299 RepID=A0ABV2D3N4_9SPHN
MAYTEVQIAEIAALNDLARAAMGVTSKVVMTQGIAALDDATRSRVFELVETFNDFTPDNDPHGERDAGFLYQDASGQWRTRWTSEVEKPALSVMWKIDYYDRALEFGSEEPWNPQVTKRVLTILLASEY